MANREQLGREFRQKSKYVVPNGITAFSMVLGLISVYFSYKGDYPTASWIILLCTVMDKLDGSTARVLNASSSFGGQLDSFSDFVAFGIAPAFMVFAICNSDQAVNVKFFAGTELPFFLYFSILFFVLASAMRLAKFNVTAVEDSGFMFGLATTASGGLIASFVLVCYEYYDYTFFIKSLQSLPYLLLILAVLEVSNFPMTKVGYQKDKKSRVAELIMLLIALLCILTRSLPEYLLMAGIVYSLMAFAYGFKERGNILQALQKQENPESNPENKSEIEKEAKNCKED